LKILQCLDKLELTWRFEPLRAGILSPLRLVTPPLSHDGQPRLTARGPNAAIVVALSLRRDRFRPGLALGSNPELNIRCFQ
jgi:hypothetical protein